MVVQALAHMSFTTAVIGCGNPYRMDDGVGPHVVALLRQRTLPPDVALFDAGADGMEVMFRARGAKRLIIVDARAPEAAPGAVFEIPGAALAVDPPHGLNLHAFRWDHALYAGRRIYGALFPEDVTVLLIEAASLEFGQGLSEPVAAAAETVAARVLALAGAAIGP